ELDQRFTLESPLARLARVHPLRLDPLAHLVEVRPVFCVRRAECDRLLGIGRCGGDEQAQQAEQDAHMLRHLRGGGLAAWVGPRRTCYAPAHHRLRRGQSGHGEAAMPEVELALRDQARAKLREGTLPVVKPSRTWGGPGAGLTCAVCDLTIGKDQIEFEV